MKSCFFLVFALSLGLGVPSAQAQTLSGPASSQSWELGTYQIYWWAPQQQLEIRQVQRTLLRHGAGQAFLEALMAKREAHENRGSFALNWQPQARCATQSLEIQPAGHELILQGELSGDPACRTPYRLTLGLSPEGHLRLSLTGLQSGVNAVQWRLARVPHEAYYGMGAQPSVLDLRGQRFRWWSRRAALVAERSRCRL